MRNQSISRYIIIIGSIAFIAYIGLRAIMIPVTHDEAGTILNFSSQSVWDIVSYKNPIPNNHILNTLLIKGLIAIFGMYEWVCRLPNILAGVAYIVFGQKCFNRLFPKDSFLQLIGFILLVANPYLVEFFSLARGYGLSVGFMVLSAYFILKEGKENTLMAVLLAGLSVYANLTLLNYFVPVIFIIFFQWWMKRPLDWSFLSKMLAIGLVLFCLLIMPVLKMIHTNQFQYWSSNGFYQDTFIPLLKSTIQGKAYFSQYTETVFTIIIITVVVSLIISLAVYLTRRRGELIYTLPLVWIFLLSIGYNILQHALFKIPYLNARTSVFYYPLFVLATFSMIAFIENASIRLVLDKVLMIFIIMAIIHMIRSYNLKSSYEWWFDADNKRVVEILDQAAMQDTGKISFKCNWLFQPSMTFYIIGQHREHITAPPYNKHVDSSAVVDYYLITSDDMSPWFKTNYTIDRAYAWDTRFLMKKKPWMDKE